jgi:hypothetical protein
MLLMSNTEDRTIHQAFTFRGPPRVLIEVYSDRVSGSPTSVGDRLRLAVCVRTITIQA